jgi:hypothetical protein
VSGRHRMAETLCGSGRFSHLSRGPAGDTPMSKSGNRLYENSAAEYYEPMGQEQQGCAPRCASVLPPRMGENRSVWKTVQCVGVEACWKNPCTSGTARTQDGRGKRREIPS